MKDNYVPIFIKWLQSLKQFDNEGNIILRSKANKKLIAYRNKLKQ